LIDSCYQAAGHITSQSSHSSMGLESFC
jgi:hypothetical protein